MDLGLWVSQERGAMEKLHGTLTTAWKLMFAGSAFLSSMFKVLSIQVFVLGFRFWIWGFRCRP